MAVSSDFLSNFVLLMLGVVFGNGTAGNGIGRRLGACLEVYADRPRMFLRRRWVFSPEIVYSLHLDRYLLDNCRQGRFVGYLNRRAKVGNA